MTVTAVEKKENNSTGLSGIDAICSFCRTISLPASKASVLQMIRDEGFPAKKIGGIWDSDSVAITDWRRIRLQIDAGLAIPKKPDKKSGKK